MELKGISQILDARAHIHEILGEFTRPERVAMMWAIIGEMEYAYVSKHPETRDQIITKMRETVDMLVKDLDKL